MKLIRLVSASLVAVAVAATVGAMSTSAQSPSSERPKAVLAASDDHTPAPFATLKGVKAIPMASRELGAVKGLHVHFFTPSKNIVDTPFGPVQGIHLAGDIKTENNWSSAWGGSDGVPVAPSYKGLCVATGLSGPGGGIVSIPQGYQQCPLP